MYLSYKDYLNFGGNLEQAAFDRFCFRAEKIVDIYTFSRLRGLPYASIRPEVRACVFELIQYISEHFANGSVREKVSESNDGYSVAYESGNAEQAIADIVYTYLCDTDLLYRGTD